MEENGLLAGQASLIQNAVILYPQVGPRNHQEAYLMILFDEKHIQV